MASCKHCRCQWYIKYPGCLFFIPHSCITTVEHIYNKKRLFQQHQHEYFLSNQKHALNSDGLTCDFVLCNSSRRFLLLHFLLLTHSPSWTVRQLINTSAVLREPPRSDLIAVRQRTVCVWTTLFERIDSQEPTAIKNKNNNNRKFHRGKSGLLCWMYIRLICELFVPPPNTCVDETKKKGLISLKWFVKRIDSLKWLVMDSYRIKCSPNPYTNG